MLTASSALSWCSSIVTFSPVYQPSTAGTFTLLAVSELFLIPALFQRTHRTPPTPASLRLPASPVQCICPAVCVWEVNYLYYHPPPPVLQADFVFSLE